MTISVHNHTHKWTVRTSKGMGRILIDDKVVSSTSAPALFDTLTENLVRAYLKGMVTITPDPIAEGVLVLDGVTPMSTPVETKMWELATPEQVCQTAKQSTGTPSTVWHLVTE